MPKLSDIPPCPVAPRSRSADRAIADYEISLLTPLFGGGVEAGVPDGTMPIRGTSIRGQLQFWWRATQGAALENREDLHKRHAEIWGTMEKRSPVEIEVRDVKHAAPRACAKYADGSRLNWEQPLGGFDSPLPYALFPFQGKAQGGAANFIESASFTLRVRYPRGLGQDVGAAVRAWVSFGGLGSRTRRGCGALRVKQKELLPANVGDMQRWFRNLAFPVARNVLEWPTVPSSFLAGSKAEEPIAAWKKAIGILKDFRQGVGIARNPGETRNRPRRSLYPEPETIRRVMKKRSPKHERMQHIPDDAFPRAEFGLPIVFHFQGQGEPPDTELYPACTTDGGRERMASPLVIKPLALADGKAVPLILRLVTPPLTGVELRLIRGEPQPLPSSTMIRDSRLAGYPKSPLEGAPSGSALEAFLNYAREQGFQEVTR